MAPLKGQKPSRPKPADGGLFVSQEALQRLLAAVQALAKQQTPESGLDKPAGRAPAAGAVTEVGIQIWEDDPFLTAVDGADPVPAAPITVGVPQDEQPLLQTQIAETRPDPDIYQPSTPEFLYWNATSALDRGINFWGTLLPAGTKWSADTDPLPVELDKDVDLNAYYSRQQGLNFFHDTVEERTVYSGESPDVVCHELGHAILDAVKPELFDAMSIEVAAFHEAFGDMSSMLCALQLPSMRQSVLDQTGGELNANSRLSQLARQLGWAIRVKYGPAAADSDSLRNAANQFFYQDPTDLPPSAPANQLSSEPHSFSRVFCGAFLDVLAGMFQVGPAGSPASDSDKLLAVAQDAGKLLIEGVRVASVGPGYYSQVAAGMVQADQSLNAGRYRAALTSSFVQRGILAPAAAVSLVRDLQTPGSQTFGVTGVAPRTRQLQFEEDNEGYKKTGPEAPALPLRPLTTRFGTTFLVHMPAEPHRFAVAPAAVTGGAEEIPSPLEDAHAFVEDLIQLDKISHENAAGVLPLELTRPGEDSPCAKTHHLVKEDGKTVLRRRHFDCGYRRCRHAR
jgi:hypothetical protein